MGMFRALAGLLFIVLILPLAAFVAFLIMNVAGVSGLLGFIIGFPIFVGILTAAVMILAAINDRINNLQEYDKSHHRTRANGAH
jgi:cobalamin biosynthesis protein CobD/CbiB